MKITDTGSKEGSLLICSPKILLNRVPDGNSLLIFPPSSPHSCSSTFLTDWHLNFCFLLQTAACAEDQMFVNTDEEQPERYTIMMMLRFQATKLLGEALGAGQLSKQSVIPQNNRSGSDDRNVWSSISVFHSESDTNISGTRDISAQEKLVEVLTSLKAFRVTKSSFVKPHERKKVFLRFDEPNYAKLIFFYSMKPVCGALTDRTISGSLWTSHLISEAQAVSNLLMFPH